MIILFTCVLCSDQLAYFFGVETGALGIDIDLIAFAHFVEELLEIRPHFDNYVVFPSSVLEIGLYFGNEVVILQTHDCLSFKFAHFIGVQNGVIEIEDHDCLLVLQQILNELFLLFCQGCTPDKHASVGCLVKLEEISLVLHDMFFPDLLQAILASPLNQLLMFANGFPNFHDGSFFFEFFLWAFLQIEEEGGFGQIRQGKFLIIDFSYWHRRGKLFVDDNSPFQFVNFASRGFIIVLQKLFQSNRYFVFLIIDPEWLLAAGADVMKRSGEGIFLSRLSYNNAT